MDVLAKKVSTHGNRNQVPPLEVPRHDWFVLRRLARNLAGRMDATQAVLPGDGRARHELYALAFLIHFTHSQDVVGDGAAPSVGFWETETVLVTPPAAATATVTVTVIAG